jgi:hypothetical protein
VSLDLGSNHMGKPNNTYMQLKVQSNVANWVLVETTICLAR